MANNFKNAVVYNISADETLPSTIYSAPTSKKAIAIEIDVSNNSSAGVTVTTLLEDESQGASTDLSITTVTGTNGSTESKQHVDDKYKAPPPRNSAGTR